ncbi:RpoE-regulated lipoprotein [Scandinavium manionii]|uniref:RpoE-regulated lipoprotein n=1 Tax=Scandinavium manionii TaxID=2926520 RepID=UPI0021667F28|nr:RpoE-regulated lipoprotein [Scandinavium manionii]MCS2168592.1 RpoE-regulated lipoprotein [Scandinavium manionii]
MKSMRLLLCALPLALTGCATVSNGFNSVHWSAAYPWNWFGSSTEVTEQGVGDLTASTPLNEEAINDALDGDYRVRSGMKTDKGTIVKYFEALKDDKVALVVNGEGGSISRIDVMDSDVPVADGAKIGTPFSEVYSKAFGNCEKASGEDSANVECKVKDSQHISYIFSGSWGGPQELMPPDDSLKFWKVSKIIWRR